MAHKFTEAEQKIYDGYIDHPYEFTDNKRFEPAAKEGRGFSPYSWVIDRIFAKAFGEGPVEDTKSYFHPNPHFKRPAYLAGLDLRSGERVRGTTDFIERWIAGGPCTLSGHQVSRHAIFRNSTHSKPIAIRYEGLIYYEWGGLPGHRFPDTAIPLEGKEWERRADALLLVRKFERGSFLYRKKMFTQFERCVRMQVPMSCRVSQVYKEHGALGLLRMYLSSRWNAVITTPNMTLAKGVSYCHVKGDGNEQYLLCSMDDAVHHLLLNTGECAIHDLTSQIIVDGKPI